MHTNLRNPALEPSPILSLDLLSLTPFSLTPFSLALLAVAALGCADAHGTSDTDGGALIVLFDATAPDTGTGSSTDDGGASTSGVCPEGTPLGAIAGKPLVTVVIDGGESLSFLLIPTTASAVEASIAATLADGAHVLTVGGRALSVDRLASFDASLLGVPGVQGILGGDAIGALVVNIDPQRGRFWLSDTIEEDALLACEHVEGDPVRAELTRLGTDWVRGSIEDREGWLSVGIGTSLGVATDSTFDALDDARPRPSLGGFYTPTGADTFFSRLTAIGSYAVGDKRVAHILTRTVPDGFFALSPPTADGSPVLGTLPADFLSHFVLSLDAAGGVLRLDGFAGDAREEPSRFFPVGIALPNDTTTPVLVANVLAGSDAAESGVVVGDTIVSIDGHDFDALPPYSRSFALGTSAPSQRIAVTIEHDGERRTLPLTTRDLLVGPAER